MNIDKQRNLLHVLSSEIGTNLPSVEAVVVGCAGPPINGCSTSTTG
jgi:hypothetical protein